MHSPDNRSGNPTRSFQSDSQVTSCIRAFEYLMGKWEKGQARLVTRKHKLKANNNAITQEEHDKIYELYHNGTQTQTELADRFGRSIAIVCKIVNGKHPLKR